MMGIEMKMKKSQEAGFQTFKHCYDAGKFQKYKFLINVSVYM